MPFKGRDALILFFGITWQIGFGPLGMYRLFETHMLRSPRKDRRRRAWKRLGLGVFLADVIPIALFLGLYLVVIPDRPGTAPIVAAAVSSLSIFGVRRLVHAFAVAHSRSAWFYDEEEIKELYERWCRPRDFPEASNFWNHFGRDSVSWSSRRSPPSVWLASNRPYGFQHMLLPI